MSSVPRRTLEELTFLYERHPDRRDVFVEGPFDASVVKWFLGSQGASAAVVYDIGTMEIPDGALIATGRRPNNRERVIYLAQQCSTVLSDQALQFTCVIDADFTHLRGDFDQLEPLLYTDYSCMEMYFLQDEVIGKFLTIWCNKTDWPVSSILASLVQVLERLFLYRFANEELGWTMDWLDKLPCVCSATWGMALDEKEFVTRLLNKNDRADQRQTFLMKTEELQSMLRRDPRYQIHGHDFTAVFEWFLHEKGVRGDRIRSETMRRGLALSADYNRLQEEGLFSRLLKRVTS